MRSLIALGVFVALVTPVLCFAQQTQTDQPSPEANDANLIPDQAPPGGLQILQVQQETVESSQSGLIGSSTRFGRFVAPTVQRRDELRRPGSSFVDGRESQVRPSTDAGNLLGNSLNARGVGRQQRTPIITDLRIRGTRTGQLQASGSYWVPARLDLDTMLSKIDSGIVQDIIAIDGPYSVIYGPGFSFIDTEIAAADRFASGPDWSGRSLVNFNSNGKQLYGREVLSTGSTNWGIRFGYGHRLGNDYESGGGEELPSSYKSRDIDMAMGYDLSPNSRIDFNLIRLDQTDVEFPGQIFDINFMVTDGFEVQYTSEDQPAWDRFTMEAWYNRTRFEGDTLGSGKRRQIPELRIINFFGFTDVDSMSTGYRGMFMLGTEEQAQILVGSDLRYIKQELNEFDIGDAPFGSGLQQNFPIPKSHTSNPGIFAEMVFPVTTELDVRLGSRVDWVSANIDELPEGRSRADLAAFLGGDNFNEHYRLYAYYLTAEYELTSCLTANAGFGHSMRAPTLTELYAVDPFLAILQQGFTQVRGNLDLDPAKLYQIDIGLDYEADCLRAGLSAFHSWVYDYITYEARGILPGSGGTGIGATYVNTDLATLGGFEAYLEYDVTSWMTPFAHMNFVEGRDHTRGSGFLSSPSGAIPRGDEEALAGINPFESIVGFRVHDSSIEQRWGIEIAARIIDNQDRVAVSLGEVESAGFSTFAIRSFLKPTESLILTAGIENLGDKDYREHLDLLTGRGVRQPGVSYYVGAEVVF